MSASEETVEGTDQDKAATASAAPEHVHQPAPGHGADATGGSATGTDGPGPVGPLAEEAADGSADDEAADETKHMYEMTLSLNVVNHLGIHLYSNLPAVLSEAVANAWDADATRVEITIDAEDHEMTIVDDGIGMTVKEINDRYLQVGYERRKDKTDVHGSVTRRGRQVMGRKGIGKLSLFSIAKTIEVRSMALRPEPFDESGEAEVHHAGLVMDVDEIDDQIGQQGGSGVYHPDPLSDDDPLAMDQRGTSIRLLRPKKDLARTSMFLRRRLARRFSTRAKDFEIVLDGTPITVADRDIYNKCRYVWISATRTK